jgi:phosphoribulokinase
MSAKHPIIAVTGSSGAGTTSVTRTFNWIFRREGINAVLVEGDSFHRYDRAQMKVKLLEAAAAGDHHFSHFGPQNNLFAELEELFKQYGQTGRGRIRRYLHDDKEALPYNQEPGTFTDWQEVPEGTDLLFYEGLHGALVTPEVNVAQHADLTIGVVPIINLEWIQKLHRDKETRGYSTEAVVDTILRRMPDYVNYICPQFSQTHINFQRVPTVVIRFANPKGIDFPYLLSMIHDSFMSRPNIIVTPGGKMELAMQLILTPLILKLMDMRRRAIGALPARVKV